MLCSSSFDDRHWKKVLSGTVVIGDTDCVGCRDRRVDIESTAFNPNTVTINVNDQVVRRGCQTFIAQPAMASCGLGVFSTGHVFTNAHCRRLIPLLLRGSWLYRERERSGW
jgi:hypothetical protein